jgi:hypothetical protein
VERSDHVELLNNQDLFRGVLKKHTNLKNIFLISSKEDCDIVDISIFKKVLSVVFRVVVGEIAKY